MKKHCIRFSDESFAPVFVFAGKSLSESLRVDNSPVLFGCRTGICGTCIIEIEKGTAHLAPPDEEEKEILDLYVDDSSNARLACQVNVQADLQIKAHCQNRWSG